MILTTFDLDEYVFGALRAGASGFLLKDAPRERILEAVQDVAAGDALVAPSVTRRLIEHFAAPASAARRRPRRARRPDPARARGAGADRPRPVQRRDRRRLVVSEKTVKTHVGRILTKLGLRDRVQAVILAYESGIVVPGEGAGP